MRRILVIGSGGAGKTAFCRRMSAATGLPAIHLDEQYWLGGWSKPSRESWTNRLDELMAGEGWIIDGNYGGSLERRLAVCDTVVFLDFPWWLCVWRVLGRYLSNRGMVREGMAAGCHERIDLGFLAWIIGYPIRQRPAVRRRLSSLPTGVRAVILRSSRAAEEFLRSVSPVPE